MDQFLRLYELSRVNPLPIEDFINYGLWFQKQTIPDLDETYVSNIKRKDGRFEVTLTDGRVVQSATIVMAPGLQYHSYRPPEYGHLPQELVSHSADHHKLDRFAGKRVVMIGRGQGALETAALLYEQGSDVEVVARHAIYWIPEDNSAIPPFLKQLRAPKAGMGSGWTNLLLEKYPYSLVQFPQATRDHILYTRHGPAGSSWLKPRILDKVPLHECQEVLKVQETDRGVKLLLSGKTVLEVDHIMLGTGYRADVKRLPMLHSSLITGMQTYMGSPVLNSRFESTIPGLYFVGFSAARSFGPFYRFVVGADAAARRVTEAVARQVAHKISRRIHGSDAAGETCVSVS
jgi:cation diffusion facilitator CzcD-associated flavoprotein CzcO